MKKGGIFSNPIAIIAVVIFLIWVFRDEIAKIRNKIILDRTPSIIDAVYDKFGNRIFVYEGDTIVYDGDGNAMYTLDKNGNARTYIHFT
jgi:hypothetical protein